MNVASLEKRYEEAAILRDKIVAVQTVLDKQKIISTSLEDQDVIAYCSEKAQAMAQVLIIRSGKMLGEKIFQLKSLNEMKEEETLSSFLKQYYEKESMLQTEILLPHRIEDIDLIFVHLFVLILQVVTMANNTICIPKAIQGPQKGISYTTLVIYDIGKNTYNKLNISLLR